MNRKTLVLPAVIGLLAPVLAACGGSDSGGEDGNADRRRYHRPVRCLEGGPGPVRPRVRLRRGLLERAAPDHPDLDGHAARRRRAGARGRQDLRFHRHRQRALLLHPAQGPRVRRRHPRHRLGREVLHRPGARHQERQRLLRAALQRRHDRDQGSQRGHLPPEEPRRHLPVQAGHTHRRHRQPRATTRRGSCATASGRRLRPVHPRSPGQEQHARQGRLHQEPPLQGAVEGRRTTRWSWTPSRMPTPWARPSKRATST